MSTIDTARADAAVTLPHRTIARRGALLATLARAGAALVAPPWGWLPALGLTSAAGLLLVALAFNGGRAVAPWTDLPLWGGLALLFAPIAARLLAARAPRAERIGLVALFGLALYLVKVFQYPLYFAYHDELIHWRTADDIVRYSELFRANSLIPVSPLFPGLEIATGALANLSGLSIFHAGLIVVGAGRLVLTLALFLFYERVGGSARVAGLATLLYLSNPKTLFFDSQFAYESLALPLALLTIALIAQRRPGAANWGGLTIAAALALGATIVSHHLTSYALVAFLALWAGSLGALRLAGARRPQAEPGGFALLGAVLGLGWLVWMAYLVVGYLAPNVVNSLLEVGRLIRGEQAGRTLFRDPTGQATPPWERAVALGSTLLIVAGLPLGLWQLWRRHRWGAAAVALAVAALAYPASLGLRLTRAGGEISDRAAVTLFVAVAFVLALGLARATGGRAGAPARGSWGWRRVAGRRVAALAALVVVFLGQIVVGAGPIWSRVPGPYLVSANARSVEAEGLAAATWARDYLGPGNRFAADRINRLLLGAQGGQYPVTHLNDGVEVSPLFTSIGYGGVQEAIVREGRIRYLLVDRRLATALPRVGVYFEANEPNANARSAPIDPAALAKFDRLANVRLLYDSGAIQIYELEEGVREPIREP